MNVCGCYSQTLLSKKIKRLNTSWRLENMLTENTLGCHAMLAEENSDERALRDAIWRLQRRSGAKTNAVVSTTTSLLQAPLSKKKTYLCLQVLDCTRYRYWRFLFKKNAYGALIKEWWIFIKNNGQVVIVVKLILNKRYNRMAVIRPV